MKAEEVLKIYNLLKENDITIHVDGGWGIDALLGRQTRSHNDLDIAIARNDVEKLRNVLKDYAEKEKDGSTEWNFVLEDQRGHEIDVHVFEFDDKGNNVYGIEYPKDSLTGVGTINGVTVNCIAAEYVIKFHENYEPKEKDLQDIKALCEKFNLKPSKGYSTFQDGKNELVRQGYNKAAEHYSSDRNEFENDKYLDKFIELLKSGTVLDIGCGAGIPIDKYLIDRGFKVIGIDISEKQIELAKKNLPEADYSVKDMSELKNGEYQVDGVVSTYAIFHTPREHHQELFNKINSFLPASGLILVTMGAGEYEGTEDDFHGATMWWSHYGPEKNREIVVNAGFEILLDEIDEGNNEKHQIIIAKKISFNEI